MTDTADALPVGTMLSEYRIDRLLGQGGFGITYRASDTQLGRTVAIKEFLPVATAFRRSLEIVARTNEAAHFEKGLNRFLDEARTLAQFRHPNIVHVHRFLQAHGTAYLVMDFEEGPTLHDHLEAIGRSMSAEEIVTFAQQMLDGIAEVHRAGFLHRDIKPSNIIVRPDGSAVLIDFGAARETIAHQTSQITAIVSPGFAPLEQYYENGNQGPWTDIYALAGVLYRVITGRRPPEAPARIYGDAFVPTATMGAGRFDPDFLEAIDWGLKVRPEDRPRNIDLWRRAFRGEDPAQIPADPEANTESPARPPRPEPSGPASTPEPSQQRSASSTFGRRARPSGPPLTTPPPPPEPSMPATSQPISSRPPPLPPQSAGLSASATAPPEEEETPSAIVRSAETVRDQISGFSAEHRASGPAPAEFAGISAQADDGEETVQRPVAEIAGTAGTPDQPAGTDGDADETMNRPIAAEGAALAAAATGAVAVAAMSQGASGEAQAVPPADEPADEPIDQPADEPVDEPIDEATLQRPLSEIELASDTRPEIDQGSAPPEAEVLPDEETLQRPLSDIELAGDQRPPIDDAPALAKPAEDEPPDEATLQRPLSEIELAGDQKPPPESSPAATEPEAGAPEEDADATVAANISFTPPPAETPAAADPPSLQKAPAGNEAEDDDTDATVAQGFNLGANFAASPPESPPDAEEIGITALGLRGLSGVDAVEAPRDEAPREEDPPRRNEASVATVTSARGHPLPPVDVADGDEDGATLIGTTPTSATLAPRPIIDTIAQDSGRPRERSSLMVWIIGTVVVGLTLGGVGATAFYFYDAYQREEQFWLDAQAADTLEAYREYETIYPDGRYVENAAARIGELEAEARARADDAAFADAQTTDTIDSFEAYVSRFPDGAHVRAARTRIGQLEEAARLAEDQAAFERAQAEGGWIGLLSYLASRPNGAFRDNASTALDSFRLGITSNLGALPVATVEEEVVFELESRWPGHVYCFYAAGNGDIARLYPNRFKDQAFMDAGATVSIPDLLQPFTIQFQTPDVTEEVWCLTTQREALANITSAIGATDLEPLPVTSLEQLITSVTNAVDQPFLESRYTIRVMEAGAEPPTR